jgi:OPA family glycerol-3-phosphate transporter-like MFS transporter
MNDAAGGTKNDLKWWQRRIFWSVWVTYFAFYLCRLNMPMAKSRLCETFSWTNEEVGIVFTALLAMYAVGQFVNGQLADRFGTRSIVSFGVLGSVVMNLAVFAVVLAAAPRTAGSKSVLWLVAIFWGANGFFQAMGWSPMVRVMAHWFPVAGRGRLMGLMGTCYQFGGAFAWFLAFFLTGYYVEAWGGDWRSVFLVPSAMFAVVGFFFFRQIRNCPEDVGLEAVNPEEAHFAEADQGSRPTIKGNILRTLSNPYIWIVALTFLLLDVTRYGFVNWLPAYLDEHDAQLATSLLGNTAMAMKRCIHPLAGSLGAIVAGWATDRFFGGRRAPVIVILLVMLGALSILFPFIDHSNTPLVITVVALIGFCTYGPHILMVGHAAQDFGKKSGAAGAAGFIDGMGYIGASLTGWGAGKLIDARGYEVTFMIFGWAAILGALLTCLIWKVGPTTDHKGNQV